MKKYFNKEKNKCLKFELKRYAYKTNFFLIIHYFQKLV